MKKKDSFLKYALWLLGFLVIFGLPFLTSNKGYDWSLFSPSEMEVFLAGELKNSGFRVISIDTDTSEFPFLLFGKTDKPISDDFFEGLNTSHRSYAMGLYDTQRRKDESTFAVCIIPDDAINYNAESQMTLRTLNRLRKLTRDAVSN